MASISCQSKIGQNPLHTFGLSSHLYYTVLLRGLFVKCMWCRLFTVVHYTKISGSSKYFKISGPYIYKIGQNFAHFHAILCSERVILSQMKENIRYFMKYLTWTLSPQDRVHSLLRALTFICQRSAVASVWRALTAADQVTRPEFNVWFQSKQ